LSALAAFDDGESRYHEPEYAKTDSKLEESFLESTPGPYKGPALETPHAFSFDLEEDDGHQGYRHQYRGHR